MSANLPHSPQPFKVAAFYKFTRPAAVASWQQALAGFCCARRIRGTILLAEEGINGTVAGTAEAIDALLHFLHADPVFASQLSDLEPKLSTAAAMPFHRLKVRIKEEIVTLRAPQANPARQVGTYVAPDEWNALIAEAGVTLIDTRNDYEVRLGSFTGATNPGTASFTGFKDYVARHLDPQRHRKVAMFCTGGIRCEKASSYLLSQGFEAVFHLKGGILDYLAQIPLAQSRWQGECFVFDERVAVGHGLSEGDTTLCRACRMPLSAADRDHPLYREGESCPHCAGDDARQAAARERQRQMHLSAARGDVHLGADVAAIAARNKAAKRARRKAAAAAAGGPG